MAERRSKRISRETTGKGIVSAVVKKVLPSVSTVVNRAIDALPFELHIPGIPRSYNFCGPGTKLKERLARGDKGINPLDEACKIHDIAYSQYSDSARRAQADRELAERAWKRVKASDSSLGEKAAAWAVTNVMKAKAKIGGGRKKKRLVRKPRGKGLYLKPYPKQGCGCKTGAGKRKRERVSKKKNVNSGKAS